MNFRKLAPILAVIGLLLFATLASAQPVSTEKLKIVLGYQPLTPTWGITIVTRAELWKKYLPNVEVERFDSMSGMPLVNNMVAGKVDIAYMGDMPAIILASKGDLAATKFVAVTDADRGGASIIIVKKGSTIKSVKDLNGKRISIPFGGYTHRFAEVLSEKEGIKFQLVGQSPEVGLTSLQSGTVDAYIPWPPYGETAIYRGFGQKLIDGTKYQFNALRGIVVTREFAEKHPKVLVGWLRAELDAHKILREHPDYAAKLIYEDWKRYDIPLDVIREQFAYTFFPDDITPEWRKVLIDGAEFLRGHKFIDKQIDFSQFIDDSYLKEAAAIPSQLDMSKLTTH